MDLIGLLAALANPRAPMIRTTVEDDSPIARARLLEGYCPSCDTLTAAAEQHPTDPTDRLSCADCGDALQPPIVIARCAVATPR